MIIFTRQQISTQSMLPVKLTLVIRIHNSVVFPHVKHIS